jgi:hypothetical protein
VAEWHRNPRVCRAAQEETQEITQWHPGASDCVDAARGRLISARLSQSVSETFVADVLARMERKIASKIAHIKNCHRFALVKMRQFVVRRGEETLSLMVPVADIVNHCPTVRGIWRVENLTSPSPSPSPPPPPPPPPSSSSSSSQTCHGAQGWTEEVFSLYAGKPFRTGDEICHSYSHHSSATDFFLDYGFAGDGMHAKAYLDVRELKGIDVSVVNSVIDAINSTALTQALQVQPESAASSAGTWQTFQSCDGREAIDKHPARRPPSIKGVVSIHL